MGVVEAHDSLLMKQVRQEDPRQWLEWVLEALVRSLVADETDADRAKLGKECERLRDVVKGWPKDLYPRAEAQEALDWVDDVLAALDSKHPTTSDIQQLIKPKRADTTYSLTQSDPPKRRRRRGGRTSTPPRPVEPMTQASVPEEPKPKPTPEAEAEPKAGTKAQRKADTKAEPKQANSEPEGDDEEPPRALALVDKPVVTALARPRPGSLRHRESSVPAEDGRRSTFPPAAHYVVLELIEDHEKLDPSLEVMTKPQGPVAEAYRSLFYRIGATSEARTIMVTSSAAEQDSAVCAANLALAIGEVSDEPALLLEARFDRPRVAKLFGFHPSECFGRRLGRHRKAPNTGWRVAQRDDCNVGLLAVDPTLPAPALDAQALAEVVAMFADNGFSYVIVDGPPAIQASDARYVARCVEGVVMTVTQGITRRSAITSSMTVLDGAPVLGYVFQES
jgi:Mrp family chromosome partitioning ATPase